MDELDRLVEQYGLSAEEVRGLVAEARADARAAVKEELRAAFVRQMRAQAVEPEARAVEPEARAVEPEARAEPKPEPKPAPPPEPKPEPRFVDSGDVTYVYCVTDADTPELSGGTGVADAAVDMVTSGDLTAVISRVPEAVFGEEALRRNLNDLVWLESAARAHQEIIDEAAATATIVPLRLCTIYASPERVREMLAEEHDRFADALDALRGKSEWGVKIYADLTAIERATGERIGFDPSAPAEGGRYFTRKQNEREVRDSARRLARECVEEAHARFEEWAADAVVNRPQNRDLAKYEGEMLLNAAYLMDDARADEFAALVRELGKRYRDDGLRFELTGPWPPYNFVPGRAETLL